MKQKLITTLLTLFVFCTPVMAKSLTLSSPNKEITVTINITDKITYTVTYNNQVLLKDCQLQLNLTNEKLGDQPKLQNSKNGTINEQITREVPMKNAVVQNYCNALLMNFKNNYSVEFRAYNDGVAYRFITQKKGDIEVENEDMILRFPSDYEAVLSQTKSFITGYEHVYTKSNTSEITNTEITHLPVLFDTRINDYKILVSEADLYDYPCLFLKGTDANTMAAVFPKYPLDYVPQGDRHLRITKEAPCIAKTQGTRNFPWRFFVLSKTDKDLVENEMVFKLSRPCEIKETNWIKPGQVAWEWWHDARLYNVDFKSGYNMDSYKYYIDFAAKYGIPYIIMDEGWAKTTADPYTPNPTIDLFELIRYGKSKNVKIILWLTWLCVENHFDVFKTFNEWGVAGMKIDFMDRSDQWMVNYYERVAKEAAKYNLLVDFHGSFKPAGLERAYPNVLSYEGVVGMEQNIGNGLATPDNNAYLPFIRNAVGPMDYTPGAMNSAHPRDYRSTRSNPMSMGTRAYQLALYVVFESGIQMLADNPILYEQEDECTRFITSVPVTWDETKALEAKAGEYLIVAKRKGNKWFLGGITNSKSRSFELKLDFLPEGKEFELTAFEDGKNARAKAIDYKKTTRKVKKGDTITVTMVEDGGFAASLQ